MPASAVVMLTHVHYKSAARRDMARLTAAAHAAGALILWDLSHSAGAVQVSLNDCDADLAVGCIFGLGPIGYELALQAAIARLTQT